MYVFCVGWGGGFPSPFTYCMQYVLKFILLIIRDLLPIVNTLTIFAQNQHKI